MDLGQDFPVLCLQCSFSSKEDVPSLSVQESTSLLQSGLLGQPYLHTSPKSGDMLLLDREAFSSAIMCKPHKAHDWIVSTGIPKVRYLPEDNLFFL